MCNMMDDEVCNSIDAIVNKGTSDLLLEVLLAISGFTRSIHLIPRVTSTSMELRLSLQSSSRRYVIVSPNQLSLRCIMIESMHVSQLRPCFEHLL